MAKYEATEQNGIWGIVCGGKFRPMNDEQDAKQFAADLNQEAANRETEYQANKAKNWAEKKAVRPRYSLTPRRLEQWNGPMFLHMTEPKQ